MSRRWLAVSSFSALLLALFVLRSELEPGERSTPSSTAAPTIPRAPRGASSAPATTSQPSCRDCKPNSVSFAPPAAPERMLTGATPDRSAVSEATRYSVLNQRLARHLASHPPQESPAQLRAHAAQQKNLELRAAAIARSGVRPGTAARP